MNTYTFENVSVKSADNNFELGAFTVHIRERNGLKSGSGAFEFPELGKSDIGKFEVVTENLSSFRIRVKRLNYGTRRAEFVTSGSVPLSEAA
jgi:hypothetical protein